MKKLLSAAVAFAAAAGILTFGVVTANAEVTGSGTAEDPYIVTTADDWKNVTKSGCIKLEGNINTDLAAQTDGILTLDLNGHTLTTSGASGMEVKHNFTLTDTAESKGAIINTNTGNSSYGVKCAVKNTNIVIKDAAVKAGGQAVMINGQDTVVDIIDSEIDGGQYALNIANGTLNVSGNTVVNGDTEYTGVSFNASGGTVNIENGIFNYNGTANTAVVSGTADVTINGGEFINKNKGKGAISTTKTFDNILKIYDGTFTGEDGSYSILDANEGDYAPKIEIYGGEYNGNFGKIKTFSVTDISVMGGEFSFDPSDYVDTEKYSVTQSGASWTVEEKTSGDVPGELKLEAVNGGSIIEGSDGYGKVFTFEADLTGKNLSDVEIKYNGQTATVFKDADAVIDSNAKFGIIVKSADKTKIESFTGEDVTLTIN